MRARLVAIAAATGLAVAAVPAHAAGPKPQIVDPTGDANGINDQGTGFGSPASMTTPVYIAAADIVSVLFATNFVTKKVHGKKLKAANGFTVTMTLAAAPTTDIEYRVSSVVAGCSNVVFEYNTSPVDGSAKVECPATPPATDILYRATTTVVGPKIIWVVPNGVFHNGTVFSQLNARTRAVEAVVTAPQIDYGESATTYTVGK